MNFGLFEVRWIGTRKRRLDAEILALLKSGWKVDAIKLHRSRTGSTLKDAHDYVKAMQSTLEISPRDPTA